MESKKRKPALIMMAVCLAIGCLIPRVLAQISVHKVADNPQPRRTMGVDVLGDKVYVHGGEMGADYSPTKTLLVYDPASNTWTQLSDSQEERAHHAFSAYDGKLWAIAGWAYQELDSVESYDPSADKWMYEASLNEKRASSPGSCVVDGILRVFGGSNGPNPIKTTEYYDETSGKWQYGPDLLYQFDCAAVARGHQVFVVHSDGVTEIFDSGTWTYGPTLPENLNDTGRVVNCGGVIYALCALTDVDQPLYRLDECSTGMKWVLAGRISELRNITHFGAVGLDANHIFVTGGAYMPFNHQLSEATYIIETGIPKIVFPCQWVAGGEWDIYSMNPDGTELRNLTADFDGDVGNCYISPDGSRVCFTGPDSTGHSQIFWMFGDGSCKTQVTISSEPYGPGWPRWFDNDTLMYYSGPSAGVGSIRIVDIDGSNDQLLVDDPSGGTGDPNPSGGYNLSPDGTTLAICSQAGSSAPTHDVYLWALATGTSIPFYVDPGNDNIDRYPVWSRDSTRVYWCHWMSPGTGTTDSAIVYKDANSPNGPNQWDGILRPAGNYQVFLGAVSPDNSALLFGSSESGDLFTIDLTTLAETNVFTGAAAVGQCDWGLLQQADLPLMTDKTAIPSMGNRTVSFDLDAGADNSNRPYTLFASLSGTQPGTLLPGGLATIPLNADWFTKFVIRKINTAMFMNFYGSLNNQGQGVAVLRTFGYQVSGLKVYFAFALTDNFDYVSNPVCLDILP